MWSLNGWTRDEYLAALKHFNETSSEGQEHNSIAASAIQQLVFEEDGWAEQQDRD